MDSRGGAFDWGGTVADCGGADEVCGVVRRNVFIFGFLCGDTPFGQRGAFCKCYRCRLAGKGFYVGADCLGDCGVFPDGLAVDVQDR